MNTIDNLCSLPQDEQLFYIAFHYAAIGMALVAPDGKWLMVNSSLCNIVGYQEKELLSLTFQDITHPDDLNQDLQYVERVLSGDLDTYQMEKRYLHKDGSLIYILLSVSLARNEDGTPRFLISQIIDITERKLLELELVKQATEDMLTGVNNRRRFYDLAGREILRGGRYGDPMILLMIDIDHFKAINDTYGHAIGDEALKRLATACKSVLREVDIFGRVGGEEFCVLLFRTDAAIGRQVAERLRKTVEKIIQPTDQGIVRFTISLGGVAFSGNEQSLEYRIKQADNCLYKAKSRGRNRVELIDEITDQSMTMENLQAGFVRLQWSKAYECGNQVIDSQHRNLFSQANALLSALIAQQDTSLCQELIDNLIAEVTTHFAVEERIIKSAGYQLVTEHQKLHKELLAKSKLLARRYQKGTVEPAEVFHFMAIEVISRHLLREDRKFFTCLHDTDSDMD
ncbi:diguanylate cyclase [Desulfopila sp. IMCC35008]|uniref:diguanylate cyclase n=1 Tax=Desulfopila sp. IMCC35008 TaxID=2653858 RepID=UPI0013D6A31C|nr:diguanylate cyclase [Desulfopila sp. IMCC35008]